MKVPRTTAVTDALLDAGQSTLASKVAAAVGFDATFPVADDEAGMIREAMESTGELAVIIERHPPFGTARIRRNLKFTGSPA